MYSIGIRAHMAQPTPELQAAEVEMVRKWLDVAERLGASHMRIFGGAVPKGATEDQAVAWAVETLKRAAEEAGKQGITLGVEDDGGITTNADRTVEIVKKADSPWVPPGRSARPAMAGCRPGKREQYTDGSAVNPAH